MREPRVNPWVLSFGGRKQSGFGRRIAEGDPTASPLLISSDGAALMGVPALR
jgi:hypothetical protein